MRRASPPGRAGVFRSRAVVGTAAAAWQVPMQVQGPREEDLSGLLFDAGSRPEALDGAPEGATGAERWCGQSWRPYTSPALPARKSTERATAMLRLQPSPIKACLRSTRRLRSGGCGRGVYPVNGAVRPAVPGPSDCTPAQEQKARARNRMRTFIEKSELESREVSARKPT